MTRGTETEAVLKDGTFRINGSKCYITNASYAKFLALTAVTNRTEGKKEISAIIVPTEARGFTVIDNYEKMGLHASNTTELVLEDVEVPEENLLGVRGEGFKQFLMTLDGEELELGQWPLESLKRLMKKHCHMRRKESSLGKLFHRFKRFSLN